MPVEPGGRESAATSGTEASLFAPVPLWERGRKGRRSSRPASDPAIDAGEPAPAGLSEPVDAAYETQPADVGVETPGRPRRDPPVGGVILGAAALAVIAAAGWIVSRPHDRGVPELTPGAVTASPAAYVAPPGSNPASPPSSQVNPPASAKPDAEAAKRAPASRRSAMPATPPKQSADVTSRVRPAPSAAESGANASATVAPTVTPPSPGSPSTDPMTVNPAPATRTTPSGDSATPSVGSSPTEPTPTPDAGTTP